MERLLELLRAEGWAASVNPDCGLDHGAWVPIVHGVFSMESYVLGAQVLLDFERELAAAQAAGGDNQSCRTRPFFHGC